MTSQVERPITGRQVAIVICSAFTIIIGVNLTLAYKAVATFPGLEVKNSYVASQSFDVDRAAQLALAWDVSARVEDGTLHLTFAQGDKTVQPVIHSAVLGRATHVAQDQRPDFVFDGHAFTAPVTLTKGNWNLRLVAEAADGTLFKQRVIVRIAK